MKTNKLSVYLIKEEFKEETSILKSTNKKVELDNSNTFFFENSYVKEPSWVSDFFNDSLNIKQALKVSSAKGILLTKINYNSKDIYFVLSFGSGRYMLQEGVIEERFGLRTTLNIIEPSSLRSIEKNSLGANPKISKEQIVKVSNFVDFGFDIEQDLLKAVTGLSINEKFGSTISGSDSFSVSTQVDITSISEFLTACYERYISKDFQTEFAWIDQIKDIRDKVLIENLNIILISKLNNKDFSKTWMAIPDLLEWSDIKGFKYIPRQKGLTDDINIVEFVESFQNGIRDFDQLKFRNVTAFSASTESECGKWSSRNCIYSEIELKGKQFIINNGKWYEIENSFVESINKSYTAIKLSQIALPEYNHIDEGDYNKQVAESNENYLLMDRKNIMHGGGHSQIEFCDILTKDKQIIHVKHYAGSSVLSHLFQQGLISGELFVSDIEFRKKLNSKLKNDWKLKDSSKRINPAEYEIIFAIISNDTAEKPNIPFFSKVSVKNVTKRLESYGYKVSIKGIRSIK